tara:strand:+ start:883 stop:1470 length:588 start_codon:yes stop_codon:yes gene_type:complete
MFIYRKEEAIPQQLCDSFIEAFENSPQYHHPGVLYGAEGSSSTSSKKSTDISFTPEWLNKPIWGNLLNQLVSIVNQNASNYYLRFQTAFDKLDHSELSPMFNMQRYLPGEGFSSYHCERASLKYSNRILAWMVYLNDVTDRGETEFYYQHHFEPAKQGKLVIWPSDWTHLHRGISSPTQTKYILTGWFTHLPNLN